MKPSSSPPSAGSRRRRGAAASKPTRRNLESHNENFYYDDESPSQPNRSNPDVLRRDDDNDSKKGRNVHSHVYNKACPIGQFFLDPCRYLIKSSRKFSVLMGSCCAAMRHREPKRRNLSQHGNIRETRRIRMDLTVVLVISFAVTYGFSSILWWYRKHCLVGDALPILIRRFDFSEVDDLGGWLYPTKPFPSYRTLSPLDEDEDDSPDYGDIEYESISLEKGEEFARQINPESEELFEKYADKEREHFKAEKSDKDMNYDDDQFYHTKGRCRRLSWTYSYKPNCNMFHEVDLSRDFDEDGAGDEEDNNYDSSYISHGFWREVWNVNNRNVPEGDENYVMKILRWKHRMDYDTHNEIHRDALIMEQLSASPRIIDMYGHCEMAVSVEAMHKELEDFVVPPNGYMKQEDLNDEEDVNPQNDFNATEKLNIAFAMAESLADLHGFKDGVIVHDDVQLCQWLWDKNGKLKLGDFNRAELRMWSEEDQEYCKHFNGRGYGNWRSPEEYKPVDLDEQIDVFSLGNNIYSLLTGLWVFYENEDDGVVQKKVIKGERAFIDDRYRTRSYAEGKLVEIMEKCWIHDTRDRISIFEAVELLREAVEENTRREATSM